MNIGKSKLSTFMKQLWSLRTRVISLTSDLSQLHCPQDRSNIEQSGNFIALFWASRPSPAGHSRAQPSPVVVRCCGPRSARLPKDIPQIGLHKVQIRPAGWGNNEGDNIQYRQTAALTTNVSLSLWKLANSDRIQTLGTVTLPSCRNLDCGFFLCTLLTPCYFCVIYYKIRTTTETSTSSRKLRNYNFHGRFDILKLLEIFYWRQRNLENISICIRTKFKKFQNCQNPKWLDQFDDLIWKLILRKPMPNVPSKRKSSYAVCTLNIEHWTFFRLLIFCSIP